MQLNYAYYIIRKSDQKIVEVTDNMVDAFNAADKAGFAYFIMQGCIITEGGQDPQAEPQEESQPDSDSK